MSIGSAFDAYVKSYIHEMLFGKGTDPDYEFNTIFEKQVESHNRDWARVHGKHAFEVYKQSGALADLMFELKDAINQPKFEIEIRGSIKGVPLLGKPDVYFINKNGHPVILDWKVNGWCSNYPVSPKKGYLRLRHGSVNRHLDKAAHKQCQPMMFEGMMINVALCLEDVDKDWAVQLATYGWLCSMDVGSNFIVGLDQLCCNNTHGLEYPEIRIAEHRLRISQRFQLDLMERVHVMWDIINSDHIFRHLSKEDSQRLCIALDAKSTALREADPSLLSLCD